MPGMGLVTMIGDERGVLMATISHQARSHAYLMKRYEYRVVDTGKHVEELLNELGAQGWQVVGVTTKKQLFIAPPQAIILMREVQPSP
jgi:hypothetical protein